LPLLIFDNHTVTQILREIKFWRIHTVQKCHFSQFKRFWILIFSEFEQLSSPKLPKWYFWIVCICQNWISRKIWVTVKWSIFNTKSILNFTFWKFLEHCGETLYCYNTCMNKLSKHELLKLQNIDFLQNINNYSLKIVKILITM